MHPGCCWGCAFTLTKRCDKRLWGGWDVPQMSPRCPSLLPCSPRAPPGVPQLPPAAHAEHPPASSRPGCCRRALPDTLPPFALLLFLLSPLPTFPAGAPAGERSELLLPRSLPAAPGTLPCPPAAPPAALRSRAAGIQPRRGEPSESEEGKQSAPGLQTSRPPVIKDRRGFP